MKAQENQLLPFLEGKKQFIIPIYQRTYSWTREQCEQLWNDIIRAATDKSVAAHFLGSVVYIQHGLYQAGGIVPLLVIDGQQRLTTLTLLLIALAKAAKLDIVSSGISHEDIYESYLVNKHGKDEQRYKLLLTQSDKDVLIHLIDQPEYARSLKTKNPIIENYQFFENQIRQGIVDPATIYAGISKLIVVDISLNKDYDNPQLIFESLNSTGVDLSQADLIRNYILMGLNSEEQSYLYKAHWYPIEQNFRRSEEPSLFDRFMRDYLTLKQGTIPNIDKVYTTFKSYHRQRITTPIKEIVEDIARFAIYYVNMAFLFEGDREIKRAMQDINILKVDVAYPFFLEVYDDYANKRLSHNDFVAILRLVESYIFRRTICGIPTNGLNRIFAALIKEIDKEHYLESTQVAILSKPGSGRFPRDDEFRNAFMIKDIYNHPRCSYLLNKLEMYHHKEPINITEYTIEHIMPQNERLPLIWQHELGPEWQEVQTRYLHTIGNLTLTGYNSELSDRPFHEKRDTKGGFADSHLRLNKSLAKQEHWNAEEIEKRAQTLADVALQVWSIPPLSAEQVLKVSRLSQKMPLAEVTGPTEHPLAGSIPENFKVIQNSEKRFFLFHKADNDWIRIPSYAVSWEWAGRWAREKQSELYSPSENGALEI